MLTNRRKNKCNTFFQIAVGLTLCLLAVCANSTQVTLQGGVVTYRGLIDANSVNQVEKLLLQNPAITTLAIESQGGDVAVGMRFGDLVRTHLLNVEVVGKICASSCANYIFVSGNKKTIAPGAVVAWHGSPLRPESIPVTETTIDAEGNSESVTFEGKTLEKYLRRPEVAAGNARARIEQLAFFRARGMDGRVTTFGQEVGCGCLWAISIDDMATFGIKNVHAPDNYPESEDWWEDALLMKIRLDNYPDYLARLKE